MAVFKEKRGKDKDPKVRPALAEEPQAFTPEDEEILDRIWDRIGREEAERAEAESAAAVPATRVERKPPSIND